MTEVTYTHTVDKDALFALMREHVETSHKANDLALQGLFAETDEEVVKLKAAELVEATKLGNLGFEIANLLISDELRDEFLAGWHASQVEA